MGLKISVTVRLPDGSLRRTDLAAGAYTLGRDPTVEVVIPAQEVSRRHARLSLGEKNFELEDLGSTSGTFINGQPISSPRRLAYPATFHLGVIEVEVKLAEAIGAGTDTVVSSAKKRGESPVSSQGHYKVEREIARGGMGAVLEAEDQQLGRKVAMKVMLLEAGASEDARQRFVREALVLARLEHPNIVPIHEMGKDAQGRLFYTMKLVKGRTLQAILNDLKKGETATVQHYTLDRLLTAYRKVCDAIAFAHHNGVIHRDLKPENVMVGEYGEVLVMDWGLAKITDDEHQFATELAKSNSGGGHDGLEGFKELSDSQLSGSAGALTVDGAVFGSPQYMPPEQAEGKVAEIDERSDIFSLGGLLYAILTLRPPVEGRTIKEVLDNVKGGKVVPPTHYNMGSATSLGGKKLPKGEIKDPKLITPLPHCPQGKVPSALSAVTMRAMAFESSKRYQTVGELSADVEAHQGGFATSAEEVGAMGQFVLLLKRHKGITVSAGVAVVLIAALTIGFMLKVNAEKTAALAAKDLAAEEAVKARSAEGEAKAASARTQLALGETKAASAQAQIALAEAAFRSGDYPAMVQALEACPPDMRDQSWDYLSAKRDNSLGTVRVTGFEQPMWVANVPGQPGQFALCKNNGEIGIVDVRDGKLLRTLDSSIKALRQVVFSGDGRLVAVRGTGQQIHLLDPATGASVKHLALPDDVTHYINLSQDGKMLAAVTEDTTTERDEAKRQTREDRYLVLMDTVTGTVRWRKKMGIYGSVLFRPDGERLMAASGGRQRYFWLINAAEGSVVTQIPVYATSQAIHPNGEMVAVGTQQGEVLLISTSTGAVVQQAKLHSGTLASLAWTGDGHLITMGGEGRIAARQMTFRLWDPEFLAPRGSFSGLDPAHVSRWSFNPTSGHLLTQDSPPRLWSIPAGREFIKKRDDRSEQGWAGAFLTDNVLIARKGFGLTLYEAKAEGRLAEISGAPDLPFSACAVHPAAGVFAVSSKIGRPPGSLKVFETKGTSYVERFAKTLPALVSDLALSLSGNDLAVTSQGGKLEVFSAKSGELQMTASGRYRRAAFVSGDKRLAALSAYTVEADGVEFHLDQLDAKTGKVLATATNLFQVEAFGTSPDGKLVAIGGGDRSVEVYDAETWKKVASFRAHDDDVGALAFHPSKPVIATASADGSVKLWDYRAGKVLDQFLGLAGNPVVLSFSPDGKLLLADGQERTTRIYKIGALDGNNREEVGAQITAQSKRGAPVASTDAEGWTDVLGALNQDLFDVSSRGWRLKDGKLIGGPRQSALALPADLRRTSYQVRIKFQQLVSREVLAVILPVGDRQVGFSLDGSKVDGYWSGMTRVDGKYGKTLPGSLPGKQIKDMEPHEMEITVRLNGLETGVNVILDGRAFYHWTGPNDLLTASPFWNAKPGYLNLCSMSDDWAVSGVKVKRLGEK